MRRQYLIEGDVQGVGFRYFTARTAHRIGIRGWVRNLQDGTVEALGEGTEQQIDAFEVALRQGPAGAVVTNVRTSDVLDEIEVPHSFLIK